MHIYICLNLSLSIKFINRSPLCPHLQIKALSINAKLLHQGDGCGLQQVNLQETAWLNPKNMLLCPSKRSRWKRSCQRMPGRESIMDHFSSQQQTETLFTVSMATLLSTVSASSSCCFLICGLLILYTKQGSSYQRGKIGMMQWLRPLCYNIYQTCKQQGVRQWGKQTALALHSMS